MLRASVVYENKFAYEAEDNKFSWSKVMKNKSFKVVSLLIFMITVLAVGCSQAAGSPNVPKSTAAAPGQHTNPAVTTPVQAAGSTNPSTLAPSNQTAVKTEAELVKISEILGNAKPMMARR